eukprot:15324763-Ditylum_brightwellii.AAC.1
MHNLLFHLIPHATYLGRFFHFMEDPIESLHRKDKELNGIFAVTTSFEKREDRKRKREDIGKNNQVQQQKNYIKCLSSRKFRGETLTKRAELKASREHIKEGRRSFDDSSIQEIALIQPHYPQIPTAGSAAGATLVPALHQAHPAL